MFFIHRSLCHSLVLKNITELLAAKQSVTQFLTMFLSQKTRIDLTVKECDASKAQLILLVRLITIIQITLVFSANHNPTKQIRNYVAICSVNLYESQYSIDFPAIVAGS